MVAWKAVGVGITSCSMDQRKNAWSYYYGVIESAMTAFLSAWTFEVPSREPNRSVRPHLVVSWAMPKSWSRISLLKSPRRTIMLPWCCCCSIIGWKSWIKCGSGCHAAVTKSHGNFLNELTNLLVDGRIVTSNLILAHLIGRDDA